MKIPESREKEIFSELLSRSDQGQVTPDADLTMMARFGVSLEVVENIKRKGMARDWPPLD